MRFPLPQTEPGDFGYGEHHRVPCAKIMGEARNRKHAFRPSSIINVSAMSYGSLSGPAIEALNRGCAIAGAMHNTGEGGISSYHKKGGDLVWQIGSGYFGCRDDQGNLSLDRLVEQCKTRAGAGHRDQTQPRCKARHRGRAPLGKDHTRDF